VVGDGMQGRSRIVNQGDLFDTRSAISRSDRSQSAHSVRWTALKSGGLKSLWLSDEGSHIQKRG
jgi:hypothetical protein